MTMWHLAGFDRDTDELVCEHPLPKLNTSDVRRILRVFDDEPMEPFLFDANEPDVFYTLAAFSDDAVVLEPERNHYLAFSSTD